MEDHGMDAIRYALFTHVRQGQLIDPRITVLGRDYKPDWVFSFQERISAVLRPRPRLSAQSRDFEPHLRSLVS